MSSQILCSRLTSSTLNFQKRAFQLSSCINSAEKAAAKKPEDKRPLWYIFPGMGSQWCGMGKELMKIPPFEESVRKSTQTLKNVGVDLTKLLAPGNQSIFGNIRDAFNAIASMQIAIYDTLTAVGLGPRPKGCFGHSVGEVYCAYCSGCITAEEAILIADSRGRALIETQDLKNPGAMAAVFASYDHVKSRCPPEVTVACHNGPKSVSISGPKKAIEAFCKKLRAEKIMAVEVNSCGIAAHCPLVEPAKDVHIKYVTEICSKNTTIDRTRDPTIWIPTSFKKNDWNCELSKKASGEFFANNLVSPVLFYDAARMVPKDAVVVEIAPKGLFQSVIKTIVPKTVSSFAPMQEEGTNRLQHFVQTVEDISKAGIHVNRDILADWKKLAK